MPFYQNATDSRRNQFALAGRKGESPIIINHSAVM
jgi:hypothetical protein